MAESMFNIYKSLAEENDAPRQAALDYSKIREGGVAAAVMAQSAGMLGGQAMEAMGYQTAPQMQAQAMEEIKALYPNPTTRQDFIGMANEFKNRGMMDMWEKVMGVVDDLEGDFTLKKWQHDVSSTKQAVGDYIKSQGKHISDRALNNLISVLKNKSEMHPALAQQVHPWVDIVDGILPTLKDLDVKDVTITVPQQSVTDTDLTNRLKDKEDVKALGSLDQYTKPLLKVQKESIDTVTEGLSLVQLARTGNTPATGQIYKMLARLNADNRLSVPEIEATKRIGGFFTRTATWFSESFTGQIPPGVLDEIEELFKSVGDSSVEVYNSKVDDTRRSFKNTTTFTDEKLGRYLPYKSAFTQINNSKGLTREEVELLPSGTKFMGLDGIEYIKQ